jgi:hypothetical protein
MTFEIYEFKIIKQKKEAISVIMSIFGLSGSSTVIMKDFYV